MVRYLSTYGTILCIHSTCSYSGITLQGGSLNRTWIVMNLSDDKKGSVSEPWARIGFTTQASRSARL